MPQTLPQLVNQSTLPAFIELFELDFTNIPALGNVNYIVNSQSGDTPIVFGGQEYNSMPVKIDGIEQSTEGALARPTITLTNINKFFGTLSFLYEDMIGSRITYIRTFEIYLNLTSRISAPPLKYFVAKKLAHTSEHIVWELRNPLDKERAYLPGRQMLKRDFPGLGINKSI